MKKQTKKIRTKIKQRTKIRSILQQEINSICPFCNNTDVGHFQIHHIDENPENNLNSNLILVCPICHSKITKGDIARKAVEQIKKKLPINQIAIECASISIDSKNCSWENYDNLSNAFIQVNSDKPKFPVLSFSLINHTAKTILLSAIQLKAKYLYSGLLGIPSPMILKSLAKFKIQLPKENKVTMYKLENEIEVPAGQAFKFQVQLYTHWHNEYYPVDGKKIVYFTFKFNNNIDITAPPIYLNCKSENEKMKIEYLG